MAVLGTYTFDSTLANTSEPILTTDFTINNTSVTTDKFNNELRMVHAATASSRANATSVATFATTNGIDAVFDFRKSSVAVNRNSIQFGILSNSTIYSNVPSTTGPRQIPASGLWLSVSISGFITPTYRTAGGAETNATVLNAFPTFAANTTYRARLQYQNGTIRVRMWLATDIEPTAWNVNMLIPSGGTLPTGSVWTGTMLSSTAPTGSTSAWFDNMTVSDFITGTDAFAQGVTVGTADALAVDPAISTVRNVNAAGVTVATALASSPDATYKATKTVNATGVTVATATATSPDALVATTKTVNAAGVTVATATASSAPDPVVAATKTVNAPGVTVATATATSPNALVAAQKTVNYTAQVSTATATSPDSLVAATMTVAIRETPATASTVMVNPRIKVRIATFAPAQDVSILNDTPTTNHAGSTLGRIELSSGEADGEGDFFLASFDTIVDGTLESAILRLYVNDNPSQAIKPAIYRITSAWDANNVTYNTRPSMTRVDTGPLTSVAPFGFIDIDVRAWLTAPGTFGLAIGQAQTGANLVHFTQESGTATQPLITAIYDSGDRTQFPPSLTASAAAGDPQVAATTVISVNVASGLQGNAHAEMRLTSVATTSNPDASFVAAPALGTAAMPGGLFSTALVVTASVVGAATAEFIGALGAGEHNGLVATNAAIARAVMRSPLEAQRDSDDPYYLRVQGQTASQDFWYRLNSVNNAVAISQTLRPNAQVFGNPSVDEYGPEGRRAVTFDGIDDYINLPDDERGVYSGTMEFVFRTTKSNQVIVSGADIILNNTFGTVPFITAVGTNGGKLEVRIEQGNSNTNVVFRGNKVVSDGQWHHVVLTWAGQLTAYVDGSLDFRRFLRERQNFVAIPDTISVQGVEAFRGDMMEFVFHAGNVLTGTQATQNYYAVFGIVPVYANAAHALAEMPAAKGKGNQKRALALYFDGNDATREIVTNLDDTYNWAGVINENFRDDAPFNLGPYKCFPQSVRYDYRPGAAGTGDRYLGGQFFDEVTGEPRYIDVSKDVNTDDYDLVFFIDLPPKSNAGISTNETKSRQAYEALIEGVRTAVDRGVSLWVPQPQLAVDLGIVDRIEAHTMGREAGTYNQQGNAFGLYDYRSSLVNPWVATADKDQQAFHHFDTHALNRYRIAATITGLTDLRGFIDDDFFYGRPRDPFRPSYFGWKLRELNDGLRIGDEFLYGMQDLFDQSKSANFDFTRKFDRFTVVSVPAASVRAGTVVTQENAKHWVAKTEIDNPYRDNATTIVLAPGDTLRGRPVGGRIFVNFMESAPDLSNISYPRQIVPANELIRSEVDKEGADKRAWAYSSFRTQTSAVTGTTTTLTTDSQTLDTENRVTGTVVGVNIEEKFPVEQVPRIGMLERGLRWLTERVITKPGDKVIRVSAMTAVAQAIKPAQSSEKSFIFKTTPAVALASIIKPASVSDPDVAVTTLPLTARATMTGYSKRIAAAPATAAAEMVENFDVVRAQGEQVVLYLHHAEATLFIKEDA